MNNNKIIIKGAREHNLKNVDLALPRNKLIVITGVSGSGKSSLAFDTIYAEGQRRYVESLSSYARQFLERIKKPEVDYIYGICPAVAIEQKTGSKNPRSTVGTTTEVYDYLRLLYARIGETICFNCGETVRKDSVGAAIDWIEKKDNTKRYYLCIRADISENKNYNDIIESIRKRGYFRVIVDGNYYDINESENISFGKEAYVVIDRFRNEAKNLRSRLADSLESAFKEGEGRIYIIDADDFKVKEFSKFYDCCGIKYEEPEPRFFSFNNPFGACPVCQGFGRTVGYDLDLIVPDKNLSIAEGAIAPWRTPKFNSFNRALIADADKYEIPISEPFKDLNEEQINYILKGTPNFRGLNKFFEILEKDAYKLHIRVLLSKYRGYAVCTACRGSRLRRESLQVKIRGNSIHDVAKMSIEKAYELFLNLKLNDFEYAVGERIYKELIKRLSFLNNVGLGYLTLDRLSSTLSGGETQRINLAASLGASLIGALYVLDEPSVGLHPRDTEKLLNLLKSLRDIGNTVIVVEHDAEIMKEADMIVDMGPKAGVDGGKIIFQGTYEEILKSNESLTGKYLSGKLKMSINGRTNARLEKWLSVYGARENNLKNIDAHIPINKLTAITGVSGSGKSTLAHDILYSGLLKLKGGTPRRLGVFERIEGSHFIKEVEIVDQSPIGKSPRSNPISYIKAFEVIRELFASTHQARAKGYKPGFFSFNVPGGRCETCSGEGYVKIEMQFLADLYLECEACHGTRYKRETQNILYKGKSIVDVLNMTVDEAVEYFCEHEKIIKYLLALKNVGLGYIKLGQPSNTLSGGESQRVKLASKIIEQKQEEGSLFIFDEPTTGLHFDDISKLIGCFNMLLKNNNTIVVIEHNLDVIRRADYIIDLGPEAGEQGGEIVCCGAPEEIVKNSMSHTGKYLSKMN